MPEMGFLGTITYTFIFGWTLLRYPPKSFFPSTFQLGDSMHTVKWIKCSILSVQLDEFLYM